MDFMSNNLTVPRGKIFFAKYLAGTMTPGPFREFGNCPEFTLTRESQTLQHFSSQKGLNTKDAEIVYASTLNGSVTTDDVKTENLALWFMGDVETISATALTDQTETFTTVAVGDTYQIGRTTQNPTGVRKLTAVTADDGATPSPATYTPGTDYEIDTELGLLTIPAGSTADGKKLVLKYGTSVSTREQVVAGEDQIEGEMKFVSFNPIGPQGDITIPRVKVSPNGDMSLMTDAESPTFQTIGLSLTVLQKGNLALAYRDGRPAA